ncbi:hypothetical protein [Thalassotalea fusca]
MQINPSLPPEFGQQSLNAPQNVNNTSQVNNLRERDRVQQGQRAERDQGRENANSSARQERFDVDQQSLALVEQEQQRRANQQELPQQSSRENETVERTQTVYDQPSQQNLSAVSVYQSVGDLAQRASIQQAFGVDLYA